MIQVNSSQFRSNLSEFFSRADAGEDIVIQRRGKPSYILVQIEDDDLQLSPQLLERLEQGRKEFAEGKTIHVSSHRQLDEFLSSM